MKTAIFGGTFDPVHAGHLQLMSAVLSSGDALIVAPTKTNPWKVTPHASLEQRLRMLELAATAEGLSISQIPQTGALCLLAIPYEYSIELLQGISRMPWFPGSFADFYWALGSDQPESWKKWKNWATEGISVRTFPIVIDIHSTDVRDGRAQLLPAIEYYAREQGLYRQLNRGS